MGDVAHDERRKRALICAVLSYLLFLLIVILSFMPTRKTISVAVGFSGKPSAVKWGGHTAGRGKRGRRSRVKINRSVATPVITPSQKSVEKPVEKSIAPKKLRRRERIAERNRLRRAAKVKKIEQIAQNKKIARKVDSSRPHVLDKVVEKKPEKAVKKPAKKQKKIVVKELVKEPEPEKKPEQVFVAEPVVPAVLAVPVVPVVPVVQSEPESVQETEQDILEIGVSDHVDDNQDTSDTGSDGDGEVSRDEYALMCAVGRSWRPPHGLKPGLSARLVVSLSAQGKVERVDIETSSRVPAYDIAARGALYRAEYPAVFWGKNIAVVFGQNG